MAHRIRVVWPAPWEADATEAARHHRLDARDDVKLLVGDGAPTLAQAVLSLPDDPAERRALKQGGSDSAQQRFAWPATAQSF